MFSNEAGIGSASIAHAAVRTPEPVTEGYVSLLEPFIDTIVICTITALVIGTSQVADPNFAGDATGVAMTSAAFERKISWFPYPLAFAAVLFAFSTMISWSYYGLKGWTYLFGESAAGQTLYKVIFCVFVALGCVVQLGPILDISDANAANNTAHDPASIEVSTDPDIQVRSLTLNFNQTAPTGAAAIDDSEQLFADYQLQRTIQRGLLEKVK